MARVKITATSKIIFFFIVILSSIFSYETATQLLTLENKILSRIEPNLAHRAGRTNTTAKPLPLQKIRIFRLE
jgi:hypothetical protein